MPVRACLMLAALCLTLSATATDLSTQKLFGKWSLTPTGWALGADLNTAALSPKWVVVGDAGARDRGGVPLEGGVQVFSATTGAWVRKILPPGAAAATQRFGGAVAISGDIAVVGAYSTNTDRGIAYIYNLATGALLRTLSASDGVAGDQFGRNVATNGTVAVVSAPYDDTNRGAIYLFNVATGLQIAKLQASDGAANHYFGYGLATEGNIIAVGASGVDGDKGAVYFYDASTQTLIKKYQPAAWAAGDAYGDALSMHEGRVVIGNYSGLSTGKAWLHDLAKNSGVALTVGGSGSSYGATVAINGPIVAVSESGNGQGRVHLFRSSDGGFLQTLLPPNGDVSPQRFGFAISLDGTTLLATAPDDSVQASGAGAAHLIKPLTQAMPYTKVVAKGDFAPGAPDISYGTIGDAFINPSSETIFTSTLTGAGAAATDTAAFTDLVTLGRQELQHRSREVFSGQVKYGAISRVSMNDYLLAMGYATLTGTGVTPANNTLVWYRTQTTSGQLFRTGSPTPDFPGNPILASVPEVVTSNLGGAMRMAAICTFKVGGLVNAGNDSGLYAASIPAAGSTLREGVTAVAPLNPGTQRIGQFAPRVCHYYTSQIYSTALTSTDTSITAANNTAIFRVSLPALEELIAQKGQEAADTLGAAITNVRYSAFIGESSNGDNAAIFRATLSGAVSTTNNERLWRKPGTGSLVQVLSKGDNPTGPGSAIKIVRIINFWGMGSAAVDSQVLALVQLAGTGVTPATDQALVLVQTDGTQRVLMREGDPAPGCQGAKIGVISRVETDAWLSGYAVVATLTGAPAGTDLALFTGNTYRGNAGDQSPLRRPFLRLRKGQLFDNQPSKVKSISLPTSSVTASGAGSTGRSRAMSYSNNLAFTVEFDNGVRQIMRGSAN